MPVIRGFVEGLEIGRAGLVVAVILQDDGNRGSYRIADLDADPERFNERLSKLGILRDAMDACEPVEVEFVSEGAANLIERVRRITRNSLTPSQETTRVSGMVMGVAVLAQNRTGPTGEAADVATVVILGTGAPQSFRLDMQVPERQVAEAQLDMLRTAQSLGETVTLDVVAKDRRIVAVYSGDFGGSVGGGGKPAAIDGFVESIAHSMLAESNLMLIELVTAPPFEAGAGGNIVKLSPFTPSEVKLAVVRGAPEYALFEAALRDKLRVRALTVEPGGRDKPDEPRDPDQPARTTGNDTQPAIARRTAGGANENVAAAVLNIRDVTSARPETAGGDKQMHLVRGAQLLHALASASRPVWIEVQRRSLDVGPDEACTEGLPSNDLTARGLRDLGLPYKAEWVGSGCFNHGVYRFQFTLQTPFEIIVDGVPRCVHAGEGGKSHFAHACLGGEHEVRVVLPEWTCKQEFVIDVYRIR